MLFPSTISVFIFLLMISFFFFFIYEIIERAYSKDNANLTTDIFLLIPIILGIYSATIELSAAEEEKTIQRKTINQQIRLQEIDEISREVSVAMVAVADVTRQLRWACAQDTNEGVQAKSINNLLISGLSNNCNPNTKHSPCWQLENVRRNSEVWATSPTRAAEFLYDKDEPDVQCYLSSLQAAAPKLRYQIEERSIRVWPLVHQLPEKLEELHQLLMEGDGLEVPDSLAPSEGSFFWFWLLVFAGGVEIGRKFHLYLYDRVISARSRTAGKDIEHRD